MADFAGFVTPLQYGAPGDAGDFAISVGGGFDVDPGHVQLDVMAGLTSAGYIPSRLLWIAIAIALVIIAGLIYQPHRAKRRAQRAPWLAALLQPGAPPRADPHAKAARHAVAGALNLVMAEFRLIGTGRVFLAFAASVTALSAFADFRQIASPAALLVMVFALSAHAGRSEARGLVSLTRVASFAPMLRRAAFVIAGGVWTTLMAMPALFRTPSLEMFSTAAGTGLIAAAVASVLATLSGSGFAPRLVLLVLWYGYSSYSG